MSFRAKPRNCCWLAAQERFRDVSASASSSSPRPPSLPRCARWTSSAPSCDVQCDEKYMKSQPMSQPPLLPARQMPPSSSPRHRESTLRCRHAPESGGLRCSPRLETQPRRKTAEYWCDPKTGAAERELEAAPKQAYSAQPLVPRAEVKTSARLTKAAVAHASNDCTGCAATRLSNVYNSSSISQGGHECPTRTTVCPCPATARASATKMAASRFRPIPLFLLSRATALAATSGRPPSACSTLPSKKPTPESAAWSGMRFLPEKRPKPNSTTGFPRNPSMRFWNSGSASKAR